MPELTEQTFAFLGASGLFGAELGLMASTRRFMGSYK